MKIKNSTHWPDWFVRRMATWCAQQVGLPTTYLKLAVFRKSKSAWGGAAWTWAKRVTVCVGHKGHFPANCGTHREGERFIDQEECLVAVTAHELFHVEAERHGSVNKQGTRRFGRGHGSSEPATCKEEIRVLNLFRQAREVLLAQWSAEPASRIAGPKPTPAEKRRAKAVADLARWERKLALAKTKVRKLTAKVKRCEVAALRPFKRREPRPPQPTPFELARQHGIHVDEHLSSTEWFVYPPPGFESEQKDPHYHDGHLACGRRELRERVEEYIKLKEQP